MKTRLCIHAFSDQPHPGTHAFRIRADLCSYFEVVEDQFDLGCPLSFCRLRHDHVVDGKEKVSSFMVGFWQGCSAPGGGVISD